MSTKNISLVSPATLQGVIDALALRSDLSEQRRMDLRSSLRTFAKAMGKSPDQMPADIGALNSKIAGLTAQMVGLSAPRWANVKSGLTLRANKSETFDCLKFTLGGAGERSDGYARTSAHALACGA